MVSRRSVRKTRYPAPGAAAADVEGRAARRRDVVPRGSRPQDHLRTQRNRETEAKETVMNRVMKLARTFLLVAGIGGVTAAAEPAMAQITCPQGYFYSSTRGCLPIGEGSILANEHLLRPDNVSPMPMFR